MNDITENSVTACLLKVHTFFNQYVGKISLKVVYGWITKNQNYQKKRGKILFTYGVQCINKKNIKDIAAAWEKL